MNSSIKTFSSVPKSLIDICCIDIRNTTNNTTNNRTKKRLFFCCVVNSFAAFNLKD